MKIRKKSSGTSLTLYPAREIMPYTARAHGVATPSIFALISHPILKFLSDLESPKNYPLIYVIQLYLLLHIHTNLFFFILNINVKVLQDSKIRKIFWIL